MSKFLRFENMAAFLDFMEKPKKAVKKKQAEPKIPIPSESQEQKDFIYWTDCMSHMYPGLDLIYSVPNGGLRDPKNAANLSLEGLKPGVPDLCLPVPRGVYHGLYIEMKRIDGGGGTSDKQDWWIEKLIAQGYCVDICKGFEAAKCLVVWYYSLGEFHA